MSTHDNKLKAEILSDTEITMQRSFNAPRELVYRAMTDPDLIPKWWGQRSSTTIVDKLDPRTGGEWRFIQRAPDGTEYAFRGTFVELEPPSKIVQTFEFEPMPGHISTDAMSLTEVEGGTLVRIVSTFASKEDRDGMLQSGMETGANETYDRLEELLATMV
ncbi:MAG: SRPBCC family protein [Thermomicrobiales bacterium]|nr:SRPBCC family protein [Thermomicrobiales bacterium]